MKLTSTQEALIKLYTVLGSAGDNDEPLVISALDTAWRSLKTSEDKEDFYRILLHVMDVVRTHHIFTGDKTIPQSGGLQKRKVARMILRYLEKNMSNFYDIAALNIFTEFSDLKAPLWYQNTTDRHKGTLKSQEKMGFDVKKLAEFYCFLIKSGSNIANVAKALPNYTTAYVKYRNLKAGREGSYKIPENRIFFKLNGKIIIEEGKLREGKSRTVKVNKGDKMYFIVPMMKHTIARAKYYNEIIAEVCKIMGWSVQEYQNFRKKQNSAEQKFSSKEVLNYTKDEFFKLLDSCRATSRIKTIRNSLFDHKTKTPVQKWGKLPAWYKEWEDKDKKLVEEILKIDDTTEEGYKKKKALQKQIKAKSTGMSIVDIIYGIAGTNDPDQIEALYQSYLSKRDFEVNVVPFVDTSGSMNNTVTLNGKRFTLREMAYLLGVIFSLNNPSTVLRGVIGIFSDYVLIKGHTYTKDTRPNQYMSRRNYQKHLSSPEKIIDPTKKLADNLASVKQGLPPIISSTNIGAVASYYVDLVQNHGYHSEDLPNVLLFITDNEHNTGDPLTKVLEDARKSIGWNPLIIMWKMNAWGNVKQNVDTSIPNYLEVSGYEPASLTAILQYITKGSISPFDAIESLRENPRYVFAKQLIA